MDPMATVFSPAASSSTEAFFTLSTPAGTPATHREQIMHATSPDLIAWTKRPERTFHADGAVYQDAGGKDFRDPFVFWNKETREFWMLLFARRASDGLGVIGVWTSADLLAWRPAPPPSYLLRATVKTSSIARLEFRFRDQGAKGGGYSLRSGQAMMGTINSRRVIVGLQLVGKAYRLPEPIYHIRSLRGEGC